MTRLDYLRTINCAYKATSFIMSCIQKQSTKIFNDKTYLSSLPILYYLQEEMTEEEILLWDEYEL